MGSLKKLLLFFFASAFLNSCMGEQAPEKAPDIPIEQADKLMISLNGEPFEDFACASREKFTFTFANKKRQVLRTDAANKIVIKSSRKSLGIEKYDAAFYDGQIFHQLFPTKAIEENQQSQVELTIDVDPFFKGKDGYLYVAFDKKFMILFADVATQ